MTFDFTPERLLSVEHLRHARLWLLLGALLICIVTYASIVAVPAPAKAIMANDKIIHCGAYAALMGWFAQLYRHDLTRLLLALVFVCMGVGIELWQGTTATRQFDGYDILANTCGVLLAWALAYTWVGNMLVSVERRSSGKQAAGAATVNTEANEH